jgi:hypothetical protein
MSQICDTEFGRMRRVERDGEDTWLLECPVCKDWGSLDDDQANGRVSVDHSGDTQSPHGGGKPCTYHETHDFGNALRSALLARKLTGHPLTYEDAAALDEEKPDAN